MRCIRYLLRILRCAIRKVHLPLIDKRNQAHVAQHGRTVN
jgi:hypothetical protein